MSARPHAQPYGPPAGLVVDPSDIQDLGDVEVSDQEDRQIGEAIAHAEHDLATRMVRVHVTGEQLALLERAAAACGIGVDAYVKEAALRRAAAEPSGASSDSSASR